MQAKSKSSKKFEYHPGMKKHQVLKEAMKYLSQVTYVDNKSKHEYICQCINKVVNNYYDNYCDNSGLIRVIESRLYPYSSLTTWLFVNHDISILESRDNDSGRKLQITRKAWMQSMYEEFLAKDE